jgi:hypothetical protein
VISNLSYITFGLVFLGLVKYKSHCIKKSCNNQTENEDLNNLQPLLQVNATTTSDTTAHETESPETPVQVETDMIANQNVVANGSSGAPENSQKLVTFQQFGIFYAMGFALICQGALSICYHVCPSDKTLQFDTTFICIICMLGHVKIYQVS